MKTLAKPMRYHVAADQQGNPSLVYKVEMLPLVYEVLGCPRTAVLTRGSSDCRRLPAGLELGDLRACRVVVPGRHVQRDFESELARRRAARFPAPAGGVSIQRSR
jgi:hypothetical protein